ncbi:hypothetical protein AVEN_272539-1 [Araneus ventricosus]|uniref:Uncharacterized protein n=1 Tax=Araneus ventricosus TaxID=182803 RepID=A0A4Y2E8U0_ARAVE|nr:hypothetical protein AVEN_272539-1 [Araneus ventricosus]
MSRQGLSTPWNDITAVELVLFKGTISYRNLRIVTMYSVLDYVQDLTPFFFSYGPSQGTGVSRRSDNTNGLSCSSACFVLRWTPRCCNV